MLKNCNLNSTNKHTFAKQLSTPVKSYSALLQLQKAERPTEIKQLLFPRKIC